MADLAAIGLSGIQAATRRMEASAHNVANWTTPDFRPLRTIQHEQAGGGSRAEITRASDPRHVDLASEVVEQILAGVSYRASGRLVDLAGELTGSLLDVLA